MAGDAFMQDHEGLHSRLKNCLQTILELEPDLERLELGGELMQEFTVLKSFMERLDAVLLDEDDVRRIERATANFLEELKGPVSAMRRRGEQRRLLQ
ncbi:hypothetical protein FVW20_01695 [Desulfovibrio oxamicus]|jgi:hypothetical protein|uniref:Uncharacterized protein n=3 Tax=Nitratidesulfovibrio TaxID=2802295 RepID=A0ABS0J013_9BACT|nr:MULTISPECIES: hypothetical protein [Nitratidesulfovibrio]MBG3875769.1 hypothetical protein [Nitratidesulfovibrio oxamicus]NHZ48331.1 hypothetical protein [Nitratidesulfovibrio liaohensis]RXF78632.1 hypothetical protein EKK70_00160 [Desulfovibrio sp. DS-1]HEU6437884.1 hypothetical protein [Nitratidesulfovibrio sp.]